MQEMRRKTEAELKALVEPVAEKYYWERYVKPYLEKRKTNEFLINIEK